MTVALDRSLMMRVKRKPREDVLTFDECVALNLFWRKGVPVPILAKAFHASKNTIYYRALTGTADSIRIRFIPIRPMRLTSWSTRWGFYQLGKNTLPTT